MKRFVEGADRRQVTLLPPCLDDYVAEDNPVRVVEVFIDELDLGALGFEGVVPEATGRPSYHPSTMLKLYLYGYLNRVQSSRRLEREAGRKRSVARNRGEWLMKKLFLPQSTSSRPRRSVIIEPIARRSIAQRWGWPRRSVRRCHAARAGLRAARTRPRHGLPRVGRGARGWGRRRLFAPHRPAGRWTR